MRVRVPFGRGMRLGVVTGASAPAGDMPLKAVADRLDDRPLYDVTRQQWLRRAGNYYAAAPGELWETALAWAADDGKRRWRCMDRPRLAAIDPDLAAAYQSRSLLSVATLARHLGQVGLLTRIRRAAELGLLSEEALPVEGGSLPPHPAETKPEHLRPAQEKALAAVLKSRAFQSFLLFGCTGSGKTEVYLRAAEAKIAAGGQVLILVPEIGLTPQWLARLASRFARVGVWHSALSHAQRQHVRRSLDKIDILVGTRSALFLPLPRLTLIVVDEEHDASFKQQEGVSYSARDLAVLLAQELGAPIVLGSATPSLESWHQANSGRYRLLHLPERIQPHPPMRPQFVDLRGSDEALAPPLIAAIAAAQKRGDQSLLYLNRRGYAPALSCTACGDVPSCPACSLRLVLHRRRRSLRCHACGFSRPAPIACEQCGESALMPLGAGTERVEEELREKLPDLRFARLDRDAVRSEKKLTRILADFAAGRLDCLIGTQMLIKGHHFPRVTLVGVINADLGLSLPDFRAGERWWQQLTQVIGRAGRGDRPGHIVIQTRNPAAPWLTRIGDEHAESILGEELALRRQLRYPPFSRWVRLLFSSANAARAHKAASAMASAMQALPHVRSVGPMPAPIERMAGRYRYELLLRDDSRRHLPWCLLPILRAVAVPSGVRRKVDVDPIDMM